jgi:hypothetical protein
VGDLRMTRIRTRLFASAHNPNMASRAVGAAGE